MQPAQAAKAWRLGLPPECRQSRNARGVFIFVRGALFYFLLFAGAFLLPSWWMRAGCLTMLPFVIGALFVIGHDAAHLSLTKSPVLNRVIGRLAMLPAYHPYTSWRFAHNVLHHGGTCLKQKHPDFPPKSKEEFDALTWWRRTIERVYRTAPGVGLCYLADFYCRYLLFPNQEKRPPEATAFHMDRLSVLAFSIAQLAVAYNLAAFTPGLSVARWMYAAVVLFPWVTWVYFMGVASFVQHTHPLTVWYDNEAEWNFYKVQLCSSTHMVLPRVAAWLLHNIMAHPAHHIDPTIPLYELPACQKLLEEFVPEHSIVVPLTTREYLRICRACKLYDYRRHCWLDFEGRPTTEPAFGN